MFFRLTLVAFLLAQTTLSGDTLAADDLPSLAEIHAAWKKREVAVKTLHMEWKESIVEPGPKAVARELRKVLWLDGMMVRYESKGLRLNIRDKFTEGVYLQSWDGKRRQSSHSNSVGLHDKDVLPHHSIFIGPDRDRSLSGNEVVVPLYYCRALDAHLGVDEIEAARPLTPTSISVVLRELGKTKCAVIAISYDHPMSREIWVDPAQDFVVRRYVQLSRGRAISTIDTEYEKDGKMVWRPKSWEQQSSISTVKAIVTKFEANPKVPVPREHFSPEIPVGSIVNDSETRARYFVRRDGTWRALLPSEDSYDQIAEEEREREEKTPPRK